jgi:hypothetical protein
MNARGHLSSETIDLLLLSSLDAAAANEAKNHIDACAKCRTRWRELNEDKEKFVQFVFPRTLEKVSSRVIEPGFFDRLRIIGPWKVFMPLAGAAIAASLAIGLFLSIPSQKQDEQYLGIKGKLADDVGIKGDARIALQVIAQRSTEGQFPVKPGTVLRPGDKLRFVVNPGNAKFVLIGSRDGSGAFTVYHPFGGDRSTAIERGAHELPGAVELDQVAGNEKLVAVFSNQPLEAKVLKQALELDPADPELKDVRVLSLEFVKAVK